jgi:hypothetical protein
LFDERPLLLELSLLFRELFLLLLDLRLLFLDGVYEDDADAIVLDSLDLPVSVENKVRINFFDILGSQAKISPPVRFDVAI